MPVACAPPNRSITDMHVTDLAFSASISLALSCLGAGILSFPWALAASRLPAFLAVSAFVMCAAFVGLSALGRQTLLCSALPRYDSSSRGRLAGLRSPRSAHRPAASESHRCQSKLRPLVLRQPRQASLRPTRRVARHGRHPTKPARLACWLPRGDRGLGSSYIGHRLAGASQIAPRSRRLLRRATGASQIASRSRRLLRRATGCGARRPRSLRPVAPLTRSLAPLYSLPQHSLRARGLQVIGLECT